MVDGSLLAVLADPAILCFVFGALAASVRSNLAFPEALTKTLSLYLLFAIGMKGGAALADSGLDAQALAALGAALLMAVVVPAWSWMALSRRIDRFDAAAVAATFGSVSAVTFIAATAMLDRLGIDWGGHMTVALVLMESPAIVMAVFLAGLARRAAARPALVGGGGLVGGAAPVGADIAPGATLAAPLNIGAVLREAFTDGAHLVLLGAMAVGALAGTVQGSAPLAGFVAGDLFKGALALFLLEMGLLVVRRLREAGSLDRSLLVFGLLAPPINATLGGGLAFALGLPLGDAFLLAVLSASASYIVVPAVVRWAIPEADPGRYFTLSLAVAFPFNLLIGLPLYHAVLAALWA